MQMLNSMNNKVALALRNTTKAVPYERALTASGLAPVAYTPDSGGALDDTAALVLMGGSDVDPALYGQAAQSECGTPDRARDDYELGLLRTALARDIPVLAICRGMQLFNVACGGTLIQNLPNSSKHRRQTGGAPVHEVVFEEPFTAMFGVARAFVNSRHHQAVNRLGDGLLPMAYDPEDGVIEGMMLPSGFWAIGVQWHPEEMAEDEVQIRLFRRFAHAVQQHLAR
jgi:gamma-glutamyl-gamma-aminobutyrate hydrolase PuuD